MKNLKENLTYNTSYFFTYQQYTGSYFRLIPSRKRREVGVRWMQAISFLRPHFQWAKRTGLETYVLRSRKEEKNYNFSYHGAWDKISKSNFSLKRTARGTTSSSYHLS